MVNHFNLSLIGLLSLAAVSSHAANVTQVNRYATVDNKPLPAQVNLLLAVQHIHFPQEIKTVGQAIEYWLRYSGLRLSAQDKQSASLQMLMRQPLPQIHRHLGPLTVKDGLDVLAAKDVFSLTHDPLLREINFKLRNSPVQVDKNVHGRKA